jgi:hypothetical protein
VERDWRRLHNEELHNLYTSLNITRVIKSRRMRWAELAARSRKMKNIYTILVAKYEGKRSLGRPRHKWEGNVRIGLREVGWEIVDWIYLNQDRDQWRAVVSTVMKLQVP